MRTKFIYTALLVVATFMASCGDKEDPDNGNLGVKLNSTEVVADKDGRVFAKLTISGLSRLDRLEVTRISGAEATVENLSRSQLSSNYEFTYQVKETDPDVILFTFVAVASDDKFTPPAELRIRKMSAASSVKLDKNTVRSEAGTGYVQAAVTISGLANVDHMVIEKTAWGKATVTKVAKADLAENYRFEYNKTSEDPEYFKFRFYTVDSDGGVSESQTLSVDDRGALGFTNLKFVSRMTGKEEHINGMPQVEHEVFNRTDETYNVGGTDLGIIWEMDPGNYGLFFGDTFGRDFFINYNAPGPNGGWWRSNVLLFSNDTDLSDGLTITGAATDESGQAREICAGGKDGSGNGDWTSIPTAAIRANGIDYVHYMNIRNWGGWITNYSSLYKSADNGKTWVRSKNVLFGGKSNFGQVGYYKHEGYVYMMGTISGRDNRPHLARFRETDMERQTEYEYWNGTTWVKGRESAAAVLIDDISGELSIGYNTKYGKWILLYFNGWRYDITYREANEITGPWSEPKKIVDGYEYWQLYGSYIHPVCLDGDKLYFIMSMWLPYNSFLMSVDLGWE